MLKDVIVETVTIESSSLKTSLVRNLKIYISAGELEILKENL